MFCLQYGAFAKLWNYMFSQEFYKYDFGSIIGMLGDGFLLLSVFPGKKGKMV
jgi:hypothetical protein